MKSTTLMLLIGASIAKNNASHQGQLVSMPLSSLSNHHHSRSSLVQRREEDMDDETGYANESTIDSVDYIDSAPTLVQLNKNDKLEGTLSVV
jgi:hypothetical protein